MTQALKFSDELDVPLCAGTFAAHGRLHIPGILDPASADWIYTVLNEEVPWQLHFNDGGRHYDLHRDQLAAMAAEKRTQLTEQLTRNAADRFQYLFWNYPVSDAVWQNTGYQSIHDFHGFVNDPRTLEVVRKITGAADIGFADCQATRYQAGNFLTTHNDDVGGKDRRIAYVFSFTRDWRPDYGGLLLFLDEAGHVEEGYMPVFNALNLFSIPAYHCVSFVAPFAKASRYSVSGWFRAGRPSL